jgi:hypothetical protein
MWDLYTNINLQTSEIGKMLDLHLFQIDTQNHPNIRNYSVHTSYSEKNEFAKIASSSRQNAEMNMKNHVGNE